MVYVHSTKKEIMFSVGNRSKRKIFFVIIFVVVFLITAIWMKQSLIFNSYTGYQSEDNNDNQNVYIKEKPKGGLKEKNIANKVIYKNENMTSLDAPHLMKTARSCVYHSGDETGSWNSNNQIMLDHFYRVINDKLASPLKHASKLTLNHVQLNPYSVIIDSLAVHFLCETITNILEEYYPVNMHETAQLCRYMDNFFDYLPVCCQHEDRNKRPHSLSETPVPINLEGYDQFLSQHSFGEKPTESKTTIEDEVTEEELNDFHRNVMNANSELPESDKPEIIDTEDTGRMLGKSRTTSKRKKVITDRVYEHKGEYKKRYPQAIVAGVKKGGTRAVLSFIAKHPLVRSAGPEVHFFDKNFEKGFDWYLEKMPTSYENEITMEKTPRYFVEEGVPERIHQLNRDMKLIFIFRDPVERAISDYTQGIANKRERKDAKKVFLKRSNSTEIDEQAQRVDVGLYFKHLKRWVHHFPIKQMFFMNGDEFIKDPVKQIIALQKFLDLPVLITEDSFEFNKTKGFWCIKVSRDRIARPDCLGASKGRKHPEIDKDLLNKLTDFYRPHNKRFFELIGQDFGWSTTKKSG